MGYRPEVDYVSNRAVSLTNDSVINPNWSGGALSNVRHILVHHDAQVVPANYNAKLRYQNQARLHNGWGYGNIGLQYHFRIDNSGRIYRARPLDKILYHSGNWKYNQHGIAICVDGYFHQPHNQYMTREQYESLWQLVNWLRSGEMYSLAKVRFLGHREVSSTACNGDNAFPFVGSYRKHRLLEVPGRIKYAFPDRQPSQTMVVWEPMQNQQEWYTVRDVKVYDLANGSVVDTIKKGTPIQLRTKTTVDGVVYLRSKWSTSNGKDYGIKRDHMTRTDPTPQPAPEPPKLEDPAAVREFDQIDTNFVPGIFISNEPVKLYNVHTGEVVKDDFSVGQEFSITQKAYSNGRTYLITEYSADRDIDNGLLLDGANLHRKTADDKPGDHEQDPKGDPDTDLENRVSALEEIVSRIVEFLQNVFTKFKK